MPQARVTAASWHLPAWQGSAAYRFSQHVVVASDSARERPLVFDTTGTETFTHRAASGSNSFTIVSAPGKATPLSATLDDGVLVQAKENAGSVSCDPFRNRLRADLFDLSWSSPSVLRPATSWSDSITSDVCVGGTQGNGRTIRHFTVIGDSAVKGAHTLVIARRDSTTLEVEGALEQHPITVKGTAQANALLYVSTASGSLLRVTKEQVSVFSVRAEGSTRSFVQKLSSAIDFER